MAKSGQARVPTKQQQAHLFDVIKTKRHSEKNTAIMQISFKLGLRAQEIALLQIKEIASLDNYTKNAARSFVLHEVVSLPAAYTKGADAMKRSKSTYKRQSVSFKVEAFDAMIRQVEALAKASSKINPEDFYPPVKKHKGKSRDLPLVDNELRKALIDYLQIRLEKNPHLKTYRSPLLNTKKWPLLP